MKWLRRWKQRRCGHYGLLRILDSSVFAPEGAVVVMECGRCEFRVIGVDVAVREAIFKGGQ